MSINTYKYLLSDLKSLKGIGLKTSKIFRKKKLTTYLIYYGDYQNLTQIEVNLLKLLTLKLVKFKQ